MNFLKTSLRFALPAALLLGMASAPAEELHTFKRIQLSDQFWSEGASFGDLNNDGINDIISGPWWWEGPEFKKRHEFYPSTTTFNLAVAVKPRRLVRWTRMR